MAFRKVSAKEWKKMGLPSSTWTISFGVGVPKKVEEHNETFSIRGQDNFKYHEHTS